MDPLLFHINHRIAHCTPQSVESLRQMIESTTRGDKTVNVSCARGLVSLVTKVK